MICSNKMYSLEFKPACEKIIKKLCRKNKTLEKALKKKINQILMNPDHYKQLKYDLTGERRVNILSSFVLKYEVDDKNKTVTLIEFDHHDQAYKR